MRPNAKKTKVRRKMNAKGTIKIGVIMFSLWKKSDGLSRMQAP